MTCCQKVTFTTTKSLVFHNESHQKNGASKKRTTIIIIIKQYQSQRVKTVHFFILCLDDYLFIFKLELNHLKVFTCFLNVQFNQLVQYFQLRLD